MRRYTPLTKLAMKIAYHAHHGQTDKDGMPYIYHPIAVAGQMADEDGIAAALLHDVAEDTAVTLQELEAQGIPHTVLDALRRLTHPTGEPYLEYLQRVRECPLALKVKLADIAHNTHPDRLASLPDERAGRLRAKYAAALEFLSSTS
jgi:hypothetical protein